MHWIRHFTVWNDRIEAVLDPNYAKLLVWILFFACLERTLQLLALSKANLDWIKNFVQHIVLSDDLNVIRRCKCLCGLLAHLNSFHQSTISIWSKTYFTSGFHVDFPLHIDRRHHLLFEEYEWIGASTKVVVFLKKFDYFIVIVAIC